MRDSDHGAEARDRRAKFVLVSCVPGDVMDRIMAWLPSWNATHSGTGLGRTAVSFPLTLFPIADEGDEIEALGEQIREEELLRSVFPLSLLTPFFGWGPRGAEAARGIQGRFVECDHVFEAVPGAEVERG